jgi:thymidylate kinase
MLITFSGLDGAGKSTLIEGLKTNLEMQDRRVTVFHMTDHIGLYAYTRLLRDWIKRGIDRPKGLLRTGDRSQDSSWSGKQAFAQCHFMAVVTGIRNSILWNKPLRRFIYLVDLLIFLFYRFYVEKVKKQVLIMDRYFYDTLVDVADGRKWLWIRFLALLTPTPSVPVYLDISPEEAYERKGEYSVDYLKRRWVAYQKVFPWVRSSVVIANNDLNTTLRTLEKVVVERMAAGSLKHLTDDCTPGR